MRQIIFTSQLLLRISKRGIKASKGRKRSLIRFIIGIIIFLWFSGMIDEGSTKFGKNIELACDDVVFDASYSDPIIYITNDGNVPIYDFQIKFSSFGSHETKNLREESDTWEDLGNYGLTQGKSFSGTLDKRGANKITLIPILRGKTDSGEEKDYVCDENQFGYDISI